jgi:hypothetical protein
MLFESASTIIAARTHVELMSPSNSGVGNVIHWLSPVPSVLKPRCGSFVATRSGNDESW